MISLSHTRLHALSFFLRIIGIALGATGFLVCFCGGAVVAMMYTSRRNARTKPEQPNFATASDVVFVSVDLCTGLSTAPEENLQPDRFKLLAARATSMTGADLELPAAAHALKTAMFDSTFLAEATSATFNGILATGKHCPVIGAIFSILKDLKDQSDKYADTLHQCQRLSVWCVGLIGTIGHLAEKVTIDAETKGLLNTAAPALLAMQELVSSSLENMHGGLAGLTHMSYIVCVDMYFYIQFVAAERKADNTV